MVVVDASDPSAFETGLTQFFFIKRRPPAVRRPPSATRPFTRAWPTVLKSWRRHPRVADGRRRQNQSFADTRAVPAHVSVSFGALM